ncbi:hypothetical protein FBU30_007025 [Linnemannia zychae]|nr:hypothetical protein FBU30_007025 [Linnemannia zychae]
MSSISLLKIPELRDLLCDQLLKTDLYNCVQVCKAWHQGFTPRLWSNIHIRSVLQSVNFSSVEARTAIRRNRRFIRSFSGPFPEALKTLCDELLAADDSALVSHPENISTKLRELRRDVWLGGDHLSRLIANSPELRTLHVSGWGSHPEELVRWIGKLDHLKKLTFFAGGADLMTQEGLGTLLRYCPMSVEILSIDCSLKGDFHLSGADRTHAKLPSPAPGAPLRYRSIKSLEVRASALNIDPTVWTPFLKKIHLTEIGRYMTDNYLEQILSACDYQPTNDTIFGIGDTNDTVTQIRAGQQRQHQAKWKAIELTVLPPIGPLSKEVLLAHTPTLEDVRVRDGDIMDADTQLQILSRSPHLHTFKVLTDRPDPESRFAVDPLQLIPPPLNSNSNVLWACETILRTLWLAIRPSVLTSNQQRQVMQQLGRLHNLEELRLFNEIDANFYQRGGPGFTDMSLENGLDELRQLKKLRIVSLMGFQHSFGETEKEWVLSQWPALVSMLVGKIVVK